MTTNHLLDIDRLGAYLAGVISGFGNLLGAEKFSDGQSNPSYLLDTSKGQYVLRRKPPGKLLKSAHAVEREFRVMRALADTEVPVPRTLLLCEDPEVIGTVFFVMSFEDGQIFWDPALPELTAAERGALYRDMIRVLAALHCIEFESVGLGDFGRPGNYFARQITRWSEQYRASETTRIDAMEEILDWLPLHLPAADGQNTLIHGDYRLDNLIIERGSPRLQAVIDWELSTLGHPLADLAYYCMCLRMPPAQQIKGLAGINRQALGIPDEREILSQYCDLRGIGEIDDWPFCLAFSFFRLAAICQGVLKRALEGTASSHAAARVGEMAPLLAQLGLEIIEQGDT